MENQPCRLNELIKNGKLTGQQAGLPDKYDKQDQFLIISSRFPISNQSGKPAYKKTGECR